MRSHLSSPFWSLLAVECAPSLHLAGSHINVFEEYRQRYNLLQYTDTFMLYRRSTYLSPLLPSLRSNGHRSAFRSESILDLCVYTCTTWLKRLRPCR
jgi:hypothetical protein